jgi:hypothetical protein
MKLNGKSRISLFSTLLAGAIFTSVGIGHASVHGLRAEEVKQAHREPVDANTLHWNLREKFEVVCRSAMVSSEMSNAGQKLTLDGNRLERKLTFSLGLNILDANDLVGLDVNHPVVLAIVDGDRADIRWAPSRSYPVREYEAVRRAGGNTTLQPSGVVVQVILAPSQAVPSSVAKLTGYFLALYAEKVIEVDVPFDPNHPWIDAAPDLRIAVTKDTPPRPGPIELRTFTPSGSSHRFTCSRRQGGPFLPWKIAGTWRFRGRWGTTWSSEPSFMILRRRPLGFRSNMPGVIRSVSAEQYVLARSSRTGMTTTPYVILSRSILWR